MFLTLHKLNQRLDKDYNLLVKLLLLLIIIIVVTLLKILKLTPFFITFTIFIPRKITENEDKLKFK